MQYNSEFGLPLNRGEDPNVSVVLAWFFPSTAYVQIWIFIPKKWFWYIARKAEARRTWDYAGRTFCKQSPVQHSETFEKQRYKSRNSVRCVLVKA